MNYKNLILKILIVVTVFGFAPSKNVLAAEAETLAVSDQIYESKLNYQCFRHPAKKSDKPRRCNICGRITKVLNKTDHK